MCPKEDTIPRRDCGHSRSGSSFSALLRHFSFYRFPSFVVLTSVAQFHPPTLALVNTFSRSSDLAFPPGGVWLEPSHDPEGLELLEKGQIDIPPLVGPFFPPD